MLTIYFYALVILFDYIRTDFVAPSPKRSFAFNLISKMHTIALAEDHPQMRGLISSIIKHLPGYTVSIEAVNGFQLLEQLHSLKKIPDIAIIDVEMAVMDGLSVTNFITTHYPAIKILAISNHIHPTIVQDMLYAGASGYMVKENLSVPLLLNAFTAICSGNAFIDDALGNKDFFKSTTTRNTINNTTHTEITEKEKTFLQLSATAISYDQIAQLMNVAKDSIYNYQKSLKEKTGLGTRQEFMIYAIQHGIAKVARFNNCPPPPALLANRIAELNFI